MVPKSIRKASRERLGSVSGRPRHAPGSPGGSPRAARDARRSARERPGMLRSRQNRRQVAPGSAKIDFFPRGSFAKRCRSDFPSIFVDFRAFRKVCEPSKVPRLSAKSRVRPLALRVTSLAQCCLEKQRKSIPKSTRNRRKSRLGPSRAPLSVDFCRSKRLGRATRATRGDAGWLGRPRRPLGLARWARPMGPSSTRLPSWQQLAGLVGQHRYR